MRPTDYEEPGHQPPPFSQRPSGLRRLTPPMLPPARLAEGFAGGDFTPGQILAAFKAAAPYLGVGPCLVRTVDWLFRFTRPQDWQPGSHPIVWPSRETQERELAVTSAQTKRINRQLAELGLVVMHDSANGKRWGKRDQKGRIVEAYGFDLSPLALRTEEFQTIAAAGRAEREAIIRLRRRVTIARASLRQTWETYAEQGIEAPAALKASGGVASRKLRSRYETSRGLEPAVAALEAIAGEARGALEAAFVACAKPLQDPEERQLLGVKVINGLPVKRSPKGLTNEPHSTTTNQTTDSKRTTVTAPKASSPSQPREQGRSTPVQGRTQHQETKVAPAELLRVAPALRAYITHASPAWSEIVDAADWLRHDLGISQPLWGEACLTMGREEAAIAIAIVAARPAGYFRSSPGGYFHGMVAKARIGALHLDRTLWGIRKARADA